MQLFVINNDFVMTKSEAFDVRRNGKPGLAVARSVLRESAAPAANEPRHIYL